MVHDGKSFVMADIPGIIEGASAGKGLGLRFLRHIERNSLLLFMVPADSDDIRNEYDVLLNELRTFNPEMLDKQRVLAITKSDMLDQELMDEIEPTLPEGIPHDADISKEEILEKGLATPEEYAVLEKYTMELFKRGAEIAAARGLILVDTKYEFGKHNGTIYLMDEIHTPDSSRYFYSEGYQERFEKGEAQKQLSKEFVREWLMDNGFQGKAGQQVPEMTDEIVTSISERYIELYEHITGETFVKENAGDIAARIEKNVTDELNGK